MGVADSHPFLVKANSVIDHYVSTKLAFSIISAKGVSPVFVGHQSYPEYRSCGEYVVFASSDGNSVSSSVLTRRPMRIPIFAMSNVVSYGCDADFKKSDFDIVLKAFHDCVFSIIEKLEKKASEDGFALSFVYFPIRSFVFLPYIDDLDGKCSLTSGFDCCLLGLTRC
jgi:hypothetical protein